MENPWRCWWRMW